MRNQNIDVYAADKIQSIGDSRWKILINRL